MPIAVNCPQCLKSYSVPDSQAGRKGTCRQCGEIFAVPASAGEVYPDPAANATARTPVQTNGPTNSGGTTAAYVAELIDESQLARPTATSPYVYTPAAASAQPSVLQNPFAAPQALPGLHDSPLAVRFGGSGMADGKRLVVSSGMELPTLCVVTGQPVASTDMQQRKFYYLHPLFFVLALSPLLFLIVYFLVRKKCTITFGLSPQKRASYRKRKMIAAAAMVVFALLCGFGIARDFMELFFVGLILSIVALLVIAYSRPQLRLVRRKAELFWFDGCSKELLLHLPEYRG